ncbi:Mut7-C RNAse domain protein [uncultured archaeon]|nr:Mut7-C RNAse domain protein [uncultured archaeon]
MARFLVDLMLMRLGRWLRLLGQDVKNPAGPGEDEGLLSLAKSEGRTLITRDRRLAEACRHADGKCILIRSSGIEEQLAELAEEGVPLVLKPRRCTICNAPLQKIESGSQEMGTWCCPACKKLYWKGGHWQKMEKMLQTVRSIHSRMNGIDQNEKDQQSP